MASLDEEIAHFRTQLTDLVKASNNFAEENLIKPGGNAYVYKGLLLRADVEIDVVIRKYSSHAFDFYNEIKKLSRLSQRNVVPFIGFCDEEDERMIVMEDVVNGGLYKNLRDPSLKMSSRLHICFDAARALKKIHDAIRSFKLLSYTENSDVYCLGVILLEVLCGRKLTIQDVNRYLSIMAENHYHEEGQQLDDNIASNLWGKMLPVSLSIFLDVAYQCLKEQPDQQSPYMFEQIVKRLKRAFDIQWKQENRSQVEEFASLKIPLRRIMSATNNFAITHNITSNTYESVYKAELGFFDIGSWSRKKKVIIKRLFNYKKLTKDFFVEIRMLTNCKHPNLPSLLGFCDEDSEMILVFDCAFKETLNGNLRNATKRANLTWEKRIRICLDIAHGLKYLQDMKGKPSMILSAHVFLDEKWTAMIADFSLSEFNSCPTSLGQSDPRLVMDDIYFLGVILFEILTGRLAYDPLYIAENVKGFASMARRHFNEGKLNKIADPGIIKETYKECSDTRKKGPTQVSFDTFSKIAYQCLMETPSERPTFEVVINSLEKALQFQRVKDTTESFLHEMSLVQNLDHLKIALKDIQLATEYFDEKYCIGSGGYGKVYKCSLSMKMKSEDELREMPHTVAIKRLFNTDDGQAKQSFLAELDALSRCAHPNVVSLLRFCDEGNEMLLVYEHASKGSLDDYLESTADKIFNLTWKRRLKMCIDIAQGLNYLHTTMDDKRRIIHRDIKSANILLCKNWDAKIADFGLSKVHPGNQTASTINTNKCAGTPFYLDPEYSRTGKLKKASDIYSFGVVLFEIFSGKVAYDSKYIRENEKGLAAIAQIRFENRTLKEILDPKMMDEAHELISTLKVGPDHESLNAFSTIAYQCLAKSQDERPTIEEVIKELKQALKFQENRRDALKFSLKDIKLGVRNFSDDNCITGGYGKLCKGEVEYINGHKKVVVKRFHISDQEHGFLREFEVVFKHKHENIIGLVGYCREQDEKIIVYENASNGCLSSYLNDISFSWSTRLKICIDIANGLNFLHGKDVGQEVVIHGDLKSSNILLTKDWKAKICGFEQALTYPTNKNIKYVAVPPKRIRKTDIEFVVGSSGCYDPLYLKTHTFTKESDIYSFGMILFEILCGRLACPDDFKDSSQFLDDRVTDIVYEGIKEQIVQNSLFIFLSIAYQCICENREERPKASEVVVQLQKALEFQEAYEIWEAKLPRNYKEVIQFSKSPEIYSTMAKKDIYNILSKGILLQDDKRWFSIGENRERNEMVTARLFSFKNHRSHKWRSNQESRFHIETSHRTLRSVAEMSDVSNLNIHIKIRTQLLPLDVQYSVHLVFKFYGPRKSHAKRLYVNLKYKMGNENLHAYFATWREDGWMMIELCRFSNYKKDTEFEVLLEGFSRCYCDSRAIYIEGIEFRAIDNVKQGKLEKLKENQQVLTSQTEMERVVYHMESAEAVVYNFSAVAPFISEPSAQSRDEWIYKVPRQQVVCLKWCIDKYQMMSQNIECGCYLVFKLAESCRGLHCPVIVRDQFDQKSKQIVHFRSPSPWNLHDTDRVPKKRRDGWMEVIVSKFNSDFVLKKGRLSRKLKLISYQGTMSGLIIRGLEFRPMEEER